MKFRNVFFLMILLIVVSTSVSFAQYESSDRSSLGVRLNMMSPTNSELKDIKSLWFSPELDYQTLFDKYDRPRLIASINWYSQGNNTSTAKMIPVNLTYVNYLDNKTERTHYIAVGAGLYSLDFKLKKRMGLITKEISDNDTKPGVTLAYGIDFGSWFVEAKYEKIMKLSRTNQDDVDFSMIGISVGSKIAL